MSKPNYILKANSKTGYFYVNWTSDKKTHRVSTRERDHRAALVKMSAIIAAVESKKPDSVTVKAVCEAYRDNRSPDVASPETIRNSLNPIIERIGSLNPTDITDVIIRDYAKWRMSQAHKSANVNKLKKAGEPIPTISAGTVIRELNALRPALNWGYRNGWIDREIRIRTPVTAPPPRERWLTKEEAKKLVDVGTKGTPHVELFILIALQTAARMSAILELKWDQVHMPPAEDGKPVFNENGITSGGYIDFGQGSGNKRRGRVPIGNNPRLFFALIGAEMVSRKTDYVIEFRGKNVVNIKKGIANAARRAGLEGVTTHVLKHTSISWLVQAGHSFEMIAKLTSTSSVVIEKIYGHHSADFLNAVGRDLSI